MPRFSMKGYYALLTHVIQCCDRRFIMEQDGRLAQYRKRLAVFLGAAVLLASATCLAMDVLLTWDANTESNLAGYKCYYRGKGVPGFTHYTTVAGFANQTSACRCTIKNLAPTGRYNYVVTAFSRDTVAQRQYSSIYFGGYTTVTNLVQQESGYSNQANVGATTVRHNVIVKGGGVFK